MAADLLVQIRRFRLRRISIILVALGALVTVAITSALIGVTNISFTQAMHEVLPWWPLGSQSALTSQEWVAFSLIRLPRIVIGILVGVALAAAGAMMQVITGNSMASPFTTGISNAAAFGASLAILFNIRILASGQLGVVLLAFVAAGLCSILVFGLAMIRGMGRHTIILTGIAFSYLFSAMGAALQFVADERELASVVNWTFGNLGRADWGQIKLLAIVAAVGTVYGVVRADAFTMVSSGEEGAISMGVDVAALRRWSSLLITLLAATAVSFTGVIGFVGLVAPHLARLLVGHNYRYSFPLSLLMGALLVVSADLVGRTVASPAVVPVGIVVSFVGVPLFIWLIWRRGGRGA